MPGRCSQEKGTEEARRGEGRKRWKGDGEGGKKEEIIGDGAAVEKELEGRRRWRRRLRREGAAAGVAGAGGEEEVGIGVCGVCCWW